jgi:hypothetical protein
VGDAYLKNTGNIGTVYEVRATWFLAGRQSVKEMRSVQIEPGRSKRVGITVPVTGDQIDSHQSMNAGKACQVKVAYVDTLGQT